MSEIINPDTDHEILESDTTGALKLRDFDFTDLYISQTGKCIARGTHNVSGPLVEIPEGVISDLGDLFISLMAQGQKDNRREFYYDYDHVRYRVSRIRSIDGEWFTLRKSKTDIPRLKDLNYPNPIVKHLGHLGSRSGLLLFSGATGQGKTTTACALLREYLHSFGDVAITIEDPPELMLNGKHGKFGRCFQLSLEEGETFGSALISALRYTPRYILLGELRKPDDASQALRAAISGHLVISTIHAGSVEETIQTMIKLTASGEEGSEFAKTMLSNGLAGVIHQKMKRINGRVAFRTETLFFGDDKGLRSSIREGNVSQLGTAISQQRSLIAKNQAPVIIK